jgi:hypothetical protein
MAYNVALNQFMQYLPSAARTDHTATGVVQTTTMSTGSTNFINVTAFSGTSITFTLADSADDVAYTTVLASAALAATGQVALTVYPGLTETANIDASAILGRKWKITSTGTITSVTYKITCLLIP